MFGALTCTFMVCTIAADSLAAVEMESDTRNQNEIIQKLFEMVKENGRMIETLEKKVDQSDIRFVAVRDYKINPTYGYLPPGIITYDKDLLGLVGNSFNATNGKFTAPTSGIYLFTISANCETSMCVIYFYVNGSIYKYIDSYRCCFYRTFVEEVVGIASLELNKGDQVWARNDHYSSIWSGNGYPLTFTGTLLTET